MAAKFTKGDSIKTTITSSQKHPPPNVGGNTMHGMPGYINAGVSKESGSMKGGKGVGPKREGPIGRKGGSGVERLAKAAPGMSVKSYKAESTGRAGTLKGSGGKMEKLTARTSAEGRRKSWVY